jgi:hypothetical protein
VAKTRGKEAEIKQVEKVIPKMPGTISDRQSRTQGMPMGQFIAGQGQQPTRTKEEIEADILKLKEAIDQQQYTKPEEKVEEKAREEIGEDLNLDYSLSSERWAGEDDEIADLINNKDRREKIESKLDELKIEDLVLHGEIIQTVKLLNGKLPVTYRTVTGAEDIGVKSSIDDLSASNPRYLVDTYSLMATCMGVKKIGNIELPSCINDKDDFDRELFKKRFKVFQRTASVILRDIVVNYIWFDRRVQRAVVAEELGNG